MGTVVMAVTTNKAEQACNSHHDSIKDGVPKDPTELKVLVSCQKEVKSQRQTAEKNSLLSANLNDYLCHNTELEVTVKLSKREWLKRWRLTSSLDLVANKNATFSEEHWNRRDSFMQYWMANDATDFHGLPQDRELVVALVSLCGKSSSTGSFVSAPYLCIKGLQDKREITTCHAVLSRKSIQERYKPLRICTTEVKLELALPTKKSMVTLI